MYRTPKLSFRCRTKRPSAARGVALLEGSAASTLPRAHPRWLRTDSQSARDVAYNPEHHDRMKHVARRHFFVRDMVESFEIEVPFVRTADNIADFFTKPIDNQHQPMKPQLSMR